MSKLYVPMLDRNGIEAADLVADWPSAHTPIGVVFSGAEVCAATSRGPEVEGKSRGPRTLKTSQLSASGNRLSTLHKNRNSNEDSQRSTELYEVALGHSTSSFLRRSTY